MEGQTTDYGAEQRGLQRRRDEAAAVRPERPATVRTIRCDVYENDEEYLILAEIPGLDRERCEVAVHDRELRIKAVREDREEGAEQFTRTFTLPYNADASEVRATARDGVLRITVGKTRESRPRRIQIEG